MLRAQYRDLLEVTKDIEDAWRKQENDCEAFAQIVWERTTDLDLSAFGEISNVPELLETAAIASLQIPSTFSDLYFKLYDNGKFWVEVLNWWGSDINVHDHNFAGVQFQLKGQSLNVVYSFEREIDTSGLAIGKLSIASAECWNEGDRSIVMPGRIQPHNVSHLSVPTVSLLIRTHPNPAYGAQNNYLAPDVAGNYGVADIVFRKKVGALRLLANGHKDDFNRAFRQVLSHQNHTENLFTLLKMVDLLFAAEHVHLLHEYALQGELEALLVRSVAYHRAQQVLTNTIKYAPGLSQEEVLAVSVLSSAYSQTSLDEILKHLEENGISLNMPSFIHEIDRKLDTNFRVQFHDSLNLLGIAYEREDQIA